MERRTTTLPIVEHRHVVEDRIGQFESLLPFPSVEEFVLHARPERLHHGIIERVSDRPERWYETRLTNSFGKGPGGEMSSMIRVDNGTLLHPSLFDGYVERVDDERRVLS